MSKEASPMNHDTRRLIIRSIALCVAIICALLLLSMLLYWEFNRSFEWHSHDTVSESQVNRLQDEMNITIISDLTFVEHWHCGAFDKTYIYVYRLDLSDKPDTITDDEYIRSILGMDSQLYKSVSSSEYSIYREDLIEIGYDTTYYFDSTIPFCEIHYRICNQTTAEIIFCY